MAQFKNRKQLKRQQNRQQARARAAAKARVGKARAEDTIEIVDLPEDTLASKIVSGSAGTPAEEQVEPVVTPNVEETPAVGQTPAGTTGRRRLPLWGKVLIGVAIALLILIVASVGLVGRFLSRISRNTDDGVATTAEAEITETAVAEDAEDATAAGTTSPLDTMDPDDITWYGQTIEPMQDDGIKNILLIGQDRRKKEGRKRSDAMIIVSINQDTGDIKLCSFLRDTYVQIPGYGGNKLNRAYELGGMDLLDETIEDNFGVHIDNNVEVDFFGFVDAMSVIGNLDIELSQEEIDFMEAHPTWADDSGADVSTWDLHAGINSMRPEEYAVYCRLRMVGNNDMERTERQRRVLTAAFKKVMEGGILYELSVADAILPYITTDMTDGEILGYVYTVVTKGMDITAQYRIPYDGTYDGETIDGASVVVCDMEANTIALQEFLYGDFEGDPIVSEEERAAGHGYDEDASTEADTEELSTEADSTDEAATEADTESAWR